VIPPSTKSPRMGTVAARYRRFARPVRCETVEIARLRTTTGTIMRVPSRWAGLSCIGRAGIYRCCQGAWALVGFTPGNKTTMPRLVGTPARLTAAIKIRYERSSGAVRAGLHRCQPWPRQAGSRPARPGIRCPAMRRSDEPIDSKTLGTEPILGLSKVIRGVGGKKCELIL